VVDSAPGPALSSGQRLDQNQPDIPIAHSLSVEALCLRVLGAGIDPHRLCPRQASPFFRRFHQLLRILGFNQVT